MNPEHMRQFVGDCTHCDRRVVGEIPKRDGTAENKIWVRCHKCDRPVPCKSKNI